MLEAINKGNIAFASVRSWGIYLKLISQVAFQMSTLKYI